MKRSTSLIVLSILIVSFLANFVLAEDLTGITPTLNTGNGPVVAIQKFIYGAYDIIRPILEIIIGEASNTGTFLAKVMLMLIIFGIVWQVAGKTPLIKNETWTMALVSIAITILSIRWFGDESIIKTVLLPYSVFGIALTAIIPFVLWFVLMEVELKGVNKRFSRKVGWTFFAVVFFALWIVRSGESGETTVAGSVGPFAYIYLITAILSIIVLSLDSEFQKMLTKASIDKYSATHNSKLAKQLHKELEEITKEYGEKGEDYESDYGNGNGFQAFSKDEKALKKKITNVRQRV